ncbi:hypothetical protein BX666DRAFT_506815 [Dichotomocladium elegans]|nr:hypothetical protein BX666DRAFT_506815 [Dichotomocladium elegans]
MPCLTGRTFGCPTSALEWEVCWQSFCVFMRKQATGHFVNRADAVVVVGMEAELVYALPYGENFRLPYVGAGVGSMLAEFLCLHAQTSYRPFRQSGRRCCCGERWKLSLCMPCLTGRTFGCPTSALEWEVCWQSFCVFMRKQATGHFVNPVAVVVVGRWKLSLCMPCLTGRTFGCPTSALEWEVCWQSFCVFMRKQATGHFVNRADAVVEVVRWKLSLCMPCLTGRTFGCPTSALEWEVCWQSFCVFMRKQATGHFVNRADAVVEVVRWKLSLCMPCLTGRTFGCPTSALEWEVCWQSFCVFMRKQATGHFVNRADAVVEVVRWKLSLCMPCLTGRTFGCPTSALEWEVCWQSFCVFMRKQATGHFVNRADAVVEVVRWKLSLCMPCLTGRTFGCPTSALEWEVCWQSFCVFMRKQATGHFVNPVAVVVVVFAWQ